MSSDSRHHHGSGERGECPCEALLLQVVRTLWLEELTPCEALSLTLELRRPYAEAGSNLLAVAEVRDQAGDALVVGQVPVDVFARALQRYQDEIEEGGREAARAAAERLRWTLRGLALPIHLDRDDARRVAESMERVFPGLLRDVLASAP